MAGHAFLQIVKGIQKTPGDNFSAEQGLDAVDFLDTTGGFALESYEMQIPALKSSAIFADSPLNDGRTLISGTLGNVTETIRVTLTAGTIIQLAAMLSKLLRFKQDCNDFWDTFNQIDPVFIKSQVNDEPGPRYALLYDIDIAIADPTNPSEPTRDLTIVIEREYGWRGIAPGANPKQWTAYKNKQKFNVSNADLTSSGTHLVTGQVLNGNDLNTLTTFVASNTVNIPAALIDGDLPALAFVYVKGVSTIPDVFMARDTRPITLPDSINGRSQLRKLCIIASEGLPSVDTTLVNDTGASRYLAGSVSGRRTETTFATTTTLAMRFSYSADENILRGRYMMFARTRQFNGAAGDIQYNVTLSHSNVFFTSETRSPQLTGTSGNSATWGLDYLGVVTIPSQNRATAQIKIGAGLVVSDETVAASRNNWVQFKVNAARVVATTARLCFNDIILIPIDEYAVEGVGGITADNLFFDNTGYLAHGDTEAVIQTRDFTSASDIHDVIEARGNMVMLKPEVDNRLVFLGRNSTNLAGATTSYNVYIDLVPRWSGLRDV